LVDERPPLVRDWQRDYATRIAWPLDHHINFYLVWTMKINKEILIKLIIKQIKDDIEKKDMLALYLLLDTCPLENLKAYLSECS